MIYLIDEPVTKNSHSKYLVDIIGHHTDVPVKVVELKNSTTINQICAVTSKLAQKVNFADVVLCPWAMKANELIDEHFNRLTELCHVVVAAGNFNGDISDWSPARADYVTTVGCLNKSGLKAVLSNWSNDKELIWLPGTNYNVGWRNDSGTSVSSAIYTAFLAESIKLKNIEMINSMIEQYKTAVYCEIKEKSNV